MKMSWMSWFSNTGRLNIGSFTFIYLLPCMSTLLSTGPSYSPPSPSPLGSSEQIFWAVDHSPCFSKLFHKSAQNCVRTLVILVSVTSFRTDNISLRFAGCKRLWRVKIVNVEKKVVVVRHGSCNNKVYYRV